MMRVDMDVDVSRRITNLQEIDLAAFSVEQCSASRNTLRREVAACGRTVPDEASPGACASDRTDPRTPARSRDVDVGVDGGAGVQTYRESPGSRSRRGRRECDRRLETDAHDGRRKRTRMKQMTRVMNRRSNAPRKSRQ